MVMSEEARREKIQAAVESHPPEGERLHVPWKDSHGDFPVVKIPLESVVLNPRSHRIRAQVESHPSRAQIAASPYSEDAQEIVSQILRDTEEFDELKTNLTDDGQREAGIVTPAGVLLNGNTRAVALRDLGRDYIRVAVLPGDGGDQELDELELKLQMRREFKQDYTFTNELLFVDELLNKYNRPPEDVAISLGWAASSEPSELRKGKEKVQQSQQLLSLVRDVQAMSGGIIPLTDFDAKRQALTEINKQYQELSRVDQTQAEQVRNTRLLGMVADVGYRELRQVEPEFLAQRLLPAMQAEPVLGENIVDLASDSRSGNSEALPGLDAPGLGSAERPVEGDLQPFLELLVKARNDESVELPSTEGPPVARSREAVVDAVRTAFENAALESAQDKKAGGKLKLPRQLIGDSAKSLTRAAYTLQELRGREDLDFAGVEEAWSALTRACDSLKAEMDQHQTSANDS